MSPEGAAPGGLPGAGQGRDTVLGSVRKDTVAPVTCLASRFFQSHRFLTDMGTEPRVQLCMRCFVGIH